MKTVFVRFDPSGTGYGIQNPGEKAPVKSEGIDTEVLSIT